MKKSTFSFMESPHLFISLFLFIFSFGIFSQENSSPSLDLKSVKPLLNFERKASDYAQSNARGFAMYMKNFNRYYFLQYINKLEKGDKILDAGAGYATALIELIANPLNNSEIPSLEGLYGKAINAQDFWSHLQEQINDLKVSDLKRNSTTGAYENIGPIEPNAIMNIFSILGINSEINYYNGQDCNSHFVGDHLYLKDLKKNVQQAIKLIDNLKKEKKFDYVVAKVQDELQKDLKNNNRYKLILDVYGAQFYSPNRAELLEMYYNALAPNGNALIILGPSNNLPQDSVIKKNLEKEEFISYLTSTYPSIFKVLRTRGGLSILIIDKPKELESSPLNFKLDFDESSAEYGDKNNVAAIERGFTYPHHILYHQ